jgi:hypothetical protein
MFSFFRKNKKKFLKPDFNGPFNKNIICKLEIKRQIEILKETNENVISMACKLALRKV